MDSTGPSALLSPSSEMLSIVRYANAVVTIPSAPLMPLAPESPFTKDRSPQAFPQGNRLYDTAAWKRYRAWRLSIQPFCQACERKGLIAIRAVDVHHLVALRYGGAPYDSNNTENLCHSCHSAETRAGR